MRDMIKRYGFCIFIACFIAIFRFVPAQAAGSVVDSDFSYMGITLGDTEETLREKWGVPSFEKTVYRRGIRLKECTYGDSLVSIAAGSGRVADIALSGDRYRLRKNVRRGATAGYIFKTYGKTSRTLLGDHTCYVYTHPGRPHWHLVLNIDPEDGFLTSARITMLPLTDEEAEEMSLESDDDADMLDLGSSFIAAKHIDISALPEEKPVRLGGYAK